MQSKTMWFDFKMAACLVESKVACVAGARRGEGIGEIRRGLERKGSAQEGGGGGSACSKPIVCFVFHGRFLIIKIAIGQK